MILDEHGLGLAAESLTVPGTAGTTTSGIGRCRVGCFCEHPVRPQWPD